MFLQTAETTGLYFWQPILLGKYQKVSDSYSKTHDIAILPYLDRIPIKILNFVPIIGLQGPELN